MPRVLRIINRFNLGGPTYNAAFLTGRMPAGYDVRLIGGIPAPGEAHSGYILDQMGVPYTEVPSMSRSVDPFNDLRAYKDIRQIIRDFRPDIVHTHAAKAGALGRMAAHRAGVDAIVHTYHGHVFDGYFSPLVSQAIRSTERWLARRTDAIVAISPAQRDDLVDRFRIAPAGKVHIIPLGLDLSRFTADLAEHRKVFRETYRVEEGEFAIGIIGRLAPVKQHDHFIRLLTFLKRRDIPCRAFIIGDGPLRRNIAAMAISAGLSVADTPGIRADLCFTSWIHHIEHALAGIDLLAMTSLHEGTPVSVIEAQAARVPVVSTDAGGTRDCLLDGESGFIVEQGDIETLADHTERLFGDAALRKQFGETGRAFVLERFSYQRLVRDMDALYRSLT